MLCSIYHFYIYSYVQIKCLKYWPSASPEMYGPVLVSPGDEEELADYVVRKFTIQMVSPPSIGIVSLLQWFSSGVFLNLQCDYSKQGRSTKLF